MNFDLNLDTLYKNQLKRMMDFYVKHKTIKLSEKKAQLKIFMISGETKSV